MLVFSYMKRLIKSKKNSLKDGINKMTYGKNAFFFYFVINEKDEDEYLKVENEIKVSSARMAKLTSELVDKGYITKICSDSDHRKMIIKLTEEGKKEKERIFIRSIAISKTIFERVGYDKMDKFIDLFITINDVACDVIYEMKGQRKDA